MIKNLFKNISPRLIRLGQKKIIILFTAFVLISFFTKIVFATPPSSPFTPGETLDPTCLPTDTNCDVLSPLTSTNIDDATYDEATWNGVTTIAPSKNAIRDKIEALVAGNHDPVTIGTANGLSLATQVLSLALASTSTTGALSSTDWNTFNGKAPLASPTFTGTVTIPTPFTLGATSVTSTGAQLNYLSSATGTTGTTSTNLVFSTSPTLVTPVLGAATYTTLSGGSITDSALTAGRVTFAGTAGLLSDDADLTFATDTLTATKLIIGAGSAITSSGVGGALGTNAFTSTAYAPLASPTFTGTVTLEGLELATSTFQSPDASSTQGYATDGTYHYGFSNGQLRRMLDDASWTTDGFTATILSSFPAGTDHMADGDIYDGVIYVPVENWDGGCVYSLQALAKIDPVSLVVTESASISAQGHEGSSLAIAPDVGTNGTLFVSSFCDGTQIFKYDMSTLAYLGTLTLDSTVSQIQGIDYRDGLLYTSSQTVTNEMQVHVIDLNGHVSDPYVVGDGTLTVTEVEGIDYSQDTIRILNVVGAEYIVYYIPPTYIDTGFAVTTDGKVVTDELTSPLIIGGTTTTSDLFLKTTSGVGTTGADMHFLVGNNGATEAMTILNSGNVGIGTTAPASKLAVEDVSTAVNVPYSPVMQIVQQNSSESSGGSYVLTAPSYGINWKRLYTANRLSDLGGVYMYGSSAWQSGMFFMVKNNTSQTGVPDKMALELKPSGNAVFSNDLSVTGALTSPTIIGGTTTTSDLFLKTTSGVGTTGADMHFLVGNNGATEAFTILNSGKVGIGQTTPTAVLHLKAGTTAASTAPLKFTSGSLLTTAEAGAVEFLTDAYYGTITTGAARKTFAFLESPSFTTPALGAATYTTLSGGNITMNASSIITDTTTGLKIGTSTTQKLGFFNSTPIVQPGATTDLGVVLSNLGLRAAGTAYPITTSGAVTLGNNLSFTPGADRTIGFSSDSSDDLIIQASNSTASPGGELRLVGGSDSDPSYPGSNVLLYGGSGTSYGNVILAHDGSIARGNVGIGCIDPDHLLELGGTGTGCDTGTGSWIAAGSTAFTANSSREWKQNIQTYDSPDILTKIINTPARTFDWKPQYCNGSDCTNNLGFIAQEFYGVLGRGDDLHVNGQDIMMAEWLGIQHLALNLEGISGTITPLSGSASESFVTVFFENVYAKIGAWMGDVGNGIEDFFANRVHTKELCVSDTEGETCITRSELDALLSGTGTAGNSGGDNPTTPEPEPTPQPEADQPSTETPPELEPVPEITPEPEPEPETPEPETVPEPEITPEPQPEIVAPETSPETEQPPVETQTPAPEPTPEPQPEP